MRLFLAILFDAPAKDALCEAARHIEDILETGSPTRREHIHLTLAFLGEQPTSKAAIAAVGQLSCAPFDFCIDTLGAFPSRDGLTVWAGVSRPDRLASLYTQLRDALAAEGIALERQPFSPHVTLFRRARLKAGKALAGMPAPRITLRAGRISLMLSTREGGRLKYTELFSRAL